MFTLSITLRHVLQEMWKWQVMEESVVMDLSIAA